VADAQQGVGRLANAVSTVGAAIAIAAVAGIMAIFAGEWSSAEVTVAAVVGAVVMAVAAWQLVRAGWGAPAGLCAFCALALIPLALGSLTDVFGWWPDDATGRDFEEQQRKEQRIVGGVLLAAILPGLSILALGLRQFWTALPPALWFGVALLFTDPFDNPQLAILQVIFGVVVAAFAAFVWEARNDADGTEGDAWWLQLGGLLLAGWGIAFSAFETRIEYSLLGVLAAIVIFLVGALRGRTTWIVAAAIPAIFPVGDIIFDYFEGLAGLLIVAVFGFAIAFVPLLLWRRRGDG
jgi:hypothetical protein